MRIELNAVSFDVDESRVGPAYFALGVRHSGSSLLNRIVRLLARYNNYNFVDIAGGLFGTSVKFAELIRSPSLSRVLYSGNVYGGFRLFPFGIAEEKIFLEGKKVLLVRDPRDALVSEYFARMHSRAPRGQSGDEDDARVDAANIEKEAIDEFVVRRAKAMARTLTEYFAVARQSGLLTFRYEDVIFHKEAMIRTILSHFNWECREQQLQAILTWVDAKPNREDPKQFIRRVTPGDHKEKLRPETVARLDSQLEKVLTAFGYRQA